MTITVYGTETTRSLRAVWALEEAGAQYRYESVDLRAGAGRRSPFIELNPGGKVPVLWLEDEAGIDGVQVIPESTAIVTWVGERFPESDLVPLAGDPDRAQYLRWLAFVAAEFEQPLWTIAKHTFAIPKKYRVPEIIETAKWEWSVVLKLLLTGLDRGPWILGNRFSAADILLTHTLRWGSRVVGDLPSPALVDYVDRAFARPACRAAIARENTQS